LSKLFHNLYKYWSNLKDTPSILYKINIWSYINIRYFKFKFTRVLTYFTLGLKSLKVNEIKIIHKDWIFENFYGNCIKYFVFIIIVAILF
jgi:hypothetical protein